MDFLKFKNNKLSVNNIDLKKITKSKKTPYYFYSFDQLNKNIIKLKSAFKSSNPLICFAVKANSNIEVIKELKNKGLGADVVSLGELKLALKVGIKAEKIVFSGVGKSIDEIEYAIKKGILSINAESKNEIDLINAVSQKLKKIINIGIRINPNIKADTNKKITTGDKINKFGISIDDFYKIIKSKSHYKNININLLSVHIGSQIKDIIFYKKLLIVIEKILKNLKKQNHNIQYVDLGGGMGIPYFKTDKEFNIKKFGKMVDQFYRKQKIKIIFEIGRYLVGNIGAIISKVIYVKKTKDRYFIILDTGMNDMARSAIYEAFHEILPLEKSTKKFKIKVEFVGPICESSDTFGLYKSYPILKDGDFVCITNCGAYGRTLSSNYNMRPLIEELVIKRNKIKTVRKRQKIENII